MNIPRIALGNYTVQNVGGCPVVNLASNECSIDGVNLTGCNAIQECDPLTGANHYQYGLPSGVVQQGAALKTEPVGTLAPAANYAPLGANAPGCATNPSLCPGTSNAPTSQPTSGQITAATSQPPVYAGTVPVSLVTPAQAIMPISSRPASSTAVSGTTGSPASTDNWFTDSMFGGVPNWALLAGGAAILFLLGGKR